MIKFAPGVEDTIYERAYRKANATRGSQDTIDDWAVGYLTELHEVLQKQIAAHPRSGSTRNLPAGHRYHPVQPGKGRKTAGDHIIWEVDVNGDVIIKAVIDSLDQF